MHPPFAVHAGAHVCDSHRHTFPPVHASFVSQRFGWIGTHAALQSSHAGQLDVAHGLHSLPGSHALPQKSDPSQDFAQSPTPKMQTPPVHSSCDLQDFEPLPVDAAFVAFEDEVLELPPVPSTMFTSAAQPAWRARTASTERRRGVDIDIVFTDSSVLRALRGASGVGAPRCRARGEAG